MVTSRKLGVNLFTTGMIASMFGVAARTVSKWCDAGALQYYRVTAVNGCSGGERRITLEALRVFSDTRQLPLPAELSGVEQLFAVGVELPGFSCFKYLGSALLAVDFSAKEHVFVLSTSLGRDEAIVTGYALRQRLPRCRLFCIIADDETRHAELKAAGYTVLHQPVNATEILRK